MLLHGFGHNRRAWDPVVDRPATERDVIVVDMPGFGASRWPPGPKFSFEALVAHLGAFIESLDIGEPHIAGNSLGGLCSLELAKQGRVASATVLSPAAFISVGGGLYVVTVPVGFQHLAVLVPDRVLRRSMRFGPLRNTLLFTAFGRTARRLLPDARMVPLPGCGHVPMSDDPDLVARVILDGSSGTAGARRQPVPGGLTGSGVR